MIDIGTRRTPLLAFESLAGVPGVEHGIFTRRGGVSLSPYDSLNVARGVGDRSECVDENRRVLAESMGKSTLVFLSQVHGTRVRRFPEDIVSEKDEGCLCGDALVTDKPEAALVIQTADCQAVLLADPRRRVVANIHSGWRGSVANIIGRTLAVMVERYACRPEDVLAGIGPSLGPCCAEFRHYRREIPESMWAYGDRRRHFDFWALSRDQLIAAGVAPEQIETAGLCTRCRTDLFFSYRAEKKTGRFAAAIALTEDKGKETGP